VGDVDKSGAIATLFISRGPENVAIAPDLQVAPTHKNELKDLILQR
jgi:hypothetical protein